MTIMAVSTALATALAVTGFAIATGGDSVILRHQFDHVSNAGNPVSVPGRVAALLEGVGARAELRRLAARGPLAFYSAPGDSAGLCYGVGAVSTGGLAVVGCPRPDSARLNFPSNETPILDLSGIEREQDGTLYLLELAGIAADGITKVGMIDANGTLHSADVVDNVYYSDLPRVPASAVVGFDSDGNEVFRSQMVPR